MYIALEQTDAFPFGKYKGKLLSEVIKNDASYLCWFHDKVDGYKIHDIYKAKEEKSYQTSGRSYSKSKRNHKSTYNHKEAMANEWGEHVFGHGPY